MFKPNDRFASRHDADCSRDREAQLWSVLTCERCARVASRFACAQGTDFLKVKARYEEHRAALERAS